MRILIDNGKAFELYERYPSHIGIFFSANYPRWSGAEYPFAMDNGAFASWQRGEPWDESNFIVALEKIKQNNFQPEFVVCPDAVGSHEETIKLWHQWHDRIKEYGVRVAFVAQDGCRRAEVPSDADYLFIGGTTDYKLKAIREFSGFRIPVHVGRVNTSGRLWLCHNYGATSVDGTGWFRGDKVQEQGLYDYLSIASGEFDKLPGSLFNPFSYIK